ncbi:MAG TPA: nucleotidyltransferase domain-containing protein [Candidatus Eisenbacteria bacterium]
MAFVEECYRGRSVRVFRFDRERSVRELRQRARQLIAAYPEAIEIRLFGSLARGTPTPGSDADIFVLLEDSAAPFLQRSAQLSTCFEGAGLACDVMAYTRSEWEALRKEGRRIVTAVLQDGLVLARRGSAPDEGSAP